MTTPPLSVLGEILKEGGFYIFSSKKYLSWLVVCVAGYSQLKAAHFNNIIKTIHYE